MLFQVSGASSSGGAGAAVAGAAGEAEVRCRPVHASVVITETLKQYADTRF